VTSVLVFCAHCGFQIYPDSEPVIRVVDEVDGSDQCLPCVIRQLGTPGITIVVPRPAEVPA
jgi:hypothetical protein